MILTQKTEINKLSKLTPGQDHEIKGQGQICGFVKILFRLYVMNQWLDFDVTYTPDKYWCGADIDSRSRSQGQRSRPNMHVCKELVSTIYHESMIGFFFIDINNRLKLTYSQGHKVKKSRSNRQLCKKKPCFDHI